MQTRTAADIQLLEIFAFLQLLDFLTTLVGIRLGAQEMNPVVRMFMGGANGVVLGLISCKLMILAGGATVLWFRRLRVVQILNYIFGLIVVWNLSQLLRLPLQ